MAAPVFTPENFPDHLVAYRARVQQRRVAIDSGTVEKSLTPGEPSPESKEFWDGVFAVRVSAAESKAFRSLSHRRPAASGEALIHACMRATTQLGRDWIESARRGDAAAVRAWLEEGFPITYQDRLTGETALHAAAGSQARPVLRVLLPLWPDFLIRDGRGRLASELAYLYGEDPVMARLLAIRERKDAIATGREIRRRPSD